ncbi:TRP75-related protein [Wolbachia endosymbiont of Ctenocephalides felis wCfeT]|uniref:TRP75-related protein n=1 Tax=Wolbachia endosymbiont of Ctenocephalides felis wCfeT TaxID=2732593 RepID=UPI0014475B4A|nr:TRP75-related protein [Wolbachia endosymbiont of Ctenocephalides felis wCfeT]
MFRVFSKILFIFTALVLGFLVAYNAEAKSKVHLSKRYIPPGNPGGKDFHTDEEFAESYKLYEKRRELLKKKKLQDRANARVSKEDLIEKLKEKRIASELSDDAEACVVDDEDDDMVNQHGINIARLKGAVFIDQDYDFQDENEQQYSQQKGVRKEVKNAASTREKKISPVNVTIKETPSKGMCSHDSIANLNSTDIDKQYSLNGSDSFKSVIDTSE